MHARYGANIYRRYGFLDAFNPQLHRPTCALADGRIVPGVGWFDTDYLGIDQGPILAMIENHRSGLVWEVMRSESACARGLAARGLHRRLAGPAA